MNSPASAVDPDGLCPLIIAGSGQKPESKEGQALIELAKSIGANVVFPFDGKSVLGSLFSIQFHTSGPIQLTENALRASDQPGSPVMAVAYSGGANTLSDSLNRNKNISPIGIDYISPGLALFGGGPLARGSQFTNRYRGNGAIDNAVNFTAAGGPDIKEHQTGGDCGHSVGCAISLISTLLENDAKATTPCKNPQLFDKQHKTGTPLGGGGGHGGGLWLIFYHCTPINNNPADDICIQVFRVRIA